ncbi:Na+/H+ antiporter NhaA [Georgenia sp. M64]|uniref:Na+/H+ antiporter NhaA n=1 Tax=Georgenia sp. M64 TaxID=3120520 RepID=UPI0030E4C5B5
MSADPRGRVQTRAGRRALLAQLSAPARRFLSTEAGSAGLLLAATVVALAWANSPWSDAYVAFWAVEAGVSVAGWELSTDLGHWVNDGLMALFFFVIGLEVRRELSVGELTDLRRAAVPVAAALGGLAVPALLFLALAPGGDAARGWGVVIGTDTAFMLGALAVVGPTFATQLRVFLLTLTVIDDIVAVSVIGVFYSESLDVAALVAMAALGALLAVFSRLGVWRAAPYVAVGLGLWVAAVQAGLHASIAGMLGGLLVAAHPPARDLVEGAAVRFRAFRQSPDVVVGRSARLGLVRAVSVNERLQTTLHPWTGYVVVPLFALANAGVDLRDGVLVEALSSRLTWAVVAALVVGKLLGVGLTSWAAVRAGLGRLPAGVGFGHVLGGAALSGIGFTVSLLIAGLAFDDPVLRDQATVGVLVAAVVATALGWAVFRLAAVLRGQTDADLPRFLDRPVDPAGDQIRGPVDAPLTLVEYGDFECPFCARATGVTDELRDRFGDDLRYVFRHLPLVDVHPRAERAARAAVAAQRQGHFWEMHDLLFSHQDRLDLADLAGYARDLGLDVEAFLRDLDEEDTAALVRADVASAEASGARGTPTFFVGAARHTGPHDTESLARALEASRRAAGGPRGR